MWTFPRLVLAPLSLKHQLVFWSYTSNVWLSPFPFMSEGLYKIKTVSNNPYGLLTRTRTDFICLLLAISNWIILEKWCKVIAFLHLALYDVSESRFANMVVSGTQQPQRPAVWIVYWHCQYCRRWMKWWVAPWLQCKIKDLNCKLCRATLTNS